MPRVARSPPATPENSLSHSYSDPELGKSSSSQDIGHSKSRPKRPRSECSPRNDFDIFKSELKEELQEMLTTWNTNQGNKISNLLEKQSMILNKLVNEVNDLKSQNSLIHKSLDEFEKSMNFMNAQYEDILKKVEVMEKERSELRSYNLTLENKIKDLEQNSRNSCVEIRNVPVPAKETHTDLTSVVTKIATTINIEINPMDVRDIRRLPGKPGSNKPIVVEFSKVNTKNLFLDSSRDYNKKRGKQDKLNTESIGLDGDKQPVFVSEYLPAGAKKLFHLAREFANQHNYQFCWTSNCNIFLRKETGAKYILVKSEQTLLELQRQEQ